MKKANYIVLLCIFCPFLTMGQMVLEVEVDQGLPLQISARSQLKVCAGTKVDLGENLSVKNNVGEVFYSWSPANKLHDATLRNPLIYINKSMKFEVIVTDSRGCVVQDEIIINADLCDDLIKQSEGEMRVYPNPSDGNFTVELPRVSENDDVILRIQNNLGQTIYHKVQHGMSLERFIRLNINNNPPGIYFIQLICGKRLYVERIQIR